MRYALSSLTAIVIALTACSAGPRPLVVGEDACRYCRMTIDDTRFGAMVRTARGKLETFDSIECLASYVTSLPATERPSGIWVANFERPTEWIAVTDAQFVHDGTLHSPMGRSFAAFAPTVPDSTLTNTYGGEVMTWNSVLERVHADAFAPVHP